MPQGTILDQSFFFPKHSRKSVTTSVDSTDRKSEDTEIVERAMPALSTAITALKAACNATLLRLPSDIYVAFCKNYKARNSIWEEIKFKSLLERLFPECQDLDSYKMKQKYYKLAKVEYVPAQKQIGREGDLQDDIHVVISGQVDVYRVIKRNSEVLSY